MYRRVLLWLVSSQADVYSLQQTARRCSSLIAFALIYLFQIDVVFSAKFRGSRLRVIVADRRSGSAYPLGCLCVCFDAGVLWLNS